VVPVVVVCVEPWLQSVGSFAIAGVGLFVGPFVLQCPVEAFDLPVLPWAVRPDRDVAGTDRHNGLGKRSAVRVGPVVVGHYLTDPFNTAYDSKNSAALIRNPAVVPPFSLGCISEYARREWSSTAECT
jgi:hypothetical protein